MREKKRAPIIGRIAGKWLGIFLSAFIWITILPAQRVRFQNYAEREGLTNQYVYNIAQDKNGFIWLGTGGGLSRYDGHDFFTPRADSLPAEVVYCSYADKLGTLWFAFKNGALWSYDGLKFSRHTLNKDQQISITGIAESDELGVIFASQDHGLFRYNEQGKAVELTLPYKPHGVSAVHVNENMLLIGQTNGLFISELYSKDATADSIEDLSYKNITSIKDAYKPHSYWIGADDGLYYIEMMTDSIVFKKIEWEYGTDMEIRIEDLCYDADSNLLVCTSTSGVYQLRFDHLTRTQVLLSRNYNTNNGLSTNNIKCAYLDHEKNLWFGTQGSGLWMQTNQFFGSFDINETGAGKEVFAVAEDKKFIWLGAERGLVSIDKISGKKKFYDQSGLPEDKVTCLFVQKDILWIGTSSSGIYKYENGEFTSFFKENNSLSNSINHITGDDKYLYAATINGIFSIDKETASYDEPIGTGYGLNHNNIKFLYRDNRGRLLFATIWDGIYEIEIKLVQDEYKVDVKNVFRVEGEKIDFRAIAEDERGNLWVSTYGRGLFILPPDSNSVFNLTSEKGLMSDYCYSLVNDNYGYVWTGHRGGLSRIDIKTRKITLFDSDNGIIGENNLNAAFRSKDNQLYFGTTEGLTYYDLKGSLLPRSAPLMNILKVVISDTEYDFSMPIELPYSAYKLRIEFVGIYFSDPDGIKYQYKLEGHDLGWSDITDERSVTYPRLEDGEYTFLVKAIAPDGTVSQISSMVKIQVKPPIWKQWWFITLLVVILVLIIIIIIKYRERKQKQIQEYLEQRLDERTREVVEQKEEIEIKNRDITDSINYAQRIQSSILPPIKRLQQHFDGSFVFYQPRDIVSGDFYWFDKISDTKFIIACADSTGHGVPGAFMSMIGTTLIKDICMRNQVNSPSKVLEELDIELRNMMTQNVDGEQSNDGMDIIVCELDIRTHYLRYASAMRPMIVFRGGDQIYVKGSRSSVGGQYDKDEKIFRDEGIQLNKGDLIYMFSDGYPDQFGGAVGKKFKMVRLKNLLKDIYQKPMEEQYEYVRSTFNLWREDFEQVDDVLFMGIKL